MRAPLGMEGGIVKQVWQSDDGRMFGSQEMIKLYELEQTYTAEIKGQSVNVAMYADILLSEAATFIDILQRYIDERDAL